MKGIYIRMMVCLIFVMLTSCECDKLNMIGSEVSIIRKSDGEEIFRSEPIKDVIVDSNGGLVLVLSKNDREGMRIATSKNENQGEWVSVFIGNVAVDDVQIILGFASGLLYFRGDFDHLVKEMKKSGMKITETNEVPTDIKSIEAILK